MEVCLKTQMWQFYNYFVDGKEELGLLEKCDYSVSGSSCCTPDCQFYTASHVCNSTDPTDLCSRKWDIAIFFLTRL